MFFQCPLTILIAQGDSRLRSFSGGFRDYRSQFDSGDIALFVAGVTMLIGVLCLVARWSERRVRNDSSLSLFWTLSKAHELTWGDRWLLWRIARNKRVSEPALLFLDPRLTAPQFMRHLAPQPAARLKVFRRTVFFGIDRLGEEHGENAAEETPQADTDRTSPEVHAQAVSEENSFPLDPTGDLAEVLGAMRAFSLQDQLVTPRESETGPQEGTSAHSQESQEEAAPTAELPAPDSPVLDLYPWLSNDWEIENADD